MINCYAEATAIIIGCFKIEVLCLSESDGTLRTNMLGCTPCLQADHLHKQELDLLTPQQRSCTADFLGEPVPSLVICFQILPSGSALKHFAGKPELNFSGCSHTLHSPQWAVLARGRKKKKKKQKKEIREKRNHCCTTEVWPQRMRVKQSRAFPAPGAERHFIISTMTQLIFLGQCSPFKGSDTRNAILHFPGKVIWET